MLRLIYAKQFKKKGLQTGTVAAVLLNRSVRMITALLSILKTGAAYMPRRLPNCPLERINYMLKDSSAALIVTTPELENKFTAEIPVSRLSMESDRPKFKPAAKTKGKQHPSDSPAYIIVIPPAAPAGQKER